MEYLATKRYLEVSQMEADIERLPTPETRWNDLEYEQKQRWEAWPLSERPVPARIRQQAATRGTAPEFLIPLDTDACRDPAMIASLWYDALEKMNGTAPNAAFLGGGANATYLAFFRRPLAVPDFITLWSVSSGGAKC
jgi:hypothetical protein